MTKELEPKLSFEYQELPSLPLPLATRSLFSFTNAKTFDAMTDEELAKHIADVRNEANAISPWPCLDFMNFLPPPMPSSGAAGTYDRIVQQLIDDPSKKILDVGCMFGTDARDLVRRGVKPEQIVCADLLPAYFSLGYKLFADSPSDDHMRNLQFKECNIFNQQHVDSLVLPSPQSGYFAIHSGKVVHLFGWERQIAVMRTLVKLLSSEPGATIFGCSVGSTDEFTGEYDMAMFTSHWGQNGLPESSNDRTVMYGHSNLSLLRMLDQVDPGSFKNEVDAVHTNSFSNFGVDTPAGKMYPERVFLNFSMIRE